MQEKIQRYIQKTKKKLWAAFPVIFFFLFLFYTVVLLFGTHFVMIVSVVTVLFKVNYKKQLTPRKVAAMILSELVLTFLAYLAVLNLPFCIFLNLTVPFLLVFLQASQFNQLGYFSYAMCFVFLQMMTTLKSDFGMVLGVMAYAMLVFAGALCLANLRKKTAWDFRSARRGLSLLAQALRDSLEGRKVQKTADEIFDIQQQLYKEAYQSRGITYMVNGMGKRKYMFALLFQRAVYFLDNPWQSRELRSSENVSLVKKLASFMEEAGSKDFREAWIQNKLLKQGRKLLEEVEGKDGEVYVFAQNFLDPFLMILESLDSIKETEPQQDWELPSSRKLFRGILIRMKPDAFELRFAMRLGVVLTAGFVYYMAFQAEHGYWFVLNAFILLRPMYEDSAYRMKTRFWGTAAGCVIVHFLLRIFQGTLGHFLLAGIMVFGMYAEVPGTVIHAVFVTCFALTMTTLALPQEIAVGLRIFYVGAAVLMVLVVNRFFFPTSMKSQFRYNIYLLFHMQHLYLGMVKKALREPVSYGDICDAQIHYHLAYDQARQYFPKLREEETSYYSRILLACWFLVSEAEQMLFLLNSRRIKPEQRDQMDEYLMFSDYILGEIQEMMHMREKYSLSDRNKLKLGYHRTMEGNPKLSSLMFQYGKELSEIYRTVLEHENERAKTGR